MRNGTSLVCLFLLAASANAVPTNQDIDNSLGHSNIVARQWRPQQLADEVAQVWQQMLNRLGHNSNIPSGGSGPWGHPSQGQDPPPKHPGQDPSAQPTAATTVQQSARISSGSSAVATETSFIASTGTPSYSDAPDGPSYTSLLPAAESTTSPFATTLASSPGSSSGSSSSSVASINPASTPNPGSPAAMGDCSALCSSLNFNNDWNVTPMSCVSHAAGTTVDTPQGQSSVGCATSFTPTVDICQVTLQVETSGTGRTYMEVWMPHGSDNAWNGRSMSTDNGGVNGCVHYVDMAYVSGLGFAAIGDNAGHNGSSFDMTWSLNNNEAIVDWAYRARHASVDVGKQVIGEYYGGNASYSYYLGCSAGGAQGMKSAQMFPDDFDGIIAGASAADFNHLQDWSSRFILLTGTEGDDTYLTEDDWITVQSAIFAQCDEALDGVNDGIIEDPTICQFDSSVLSDSLTATQITTVNKVFSELYDSDGKLLFPALLYGSQVDAFRLGQLSGSVQGIVRDWFRGGIYNDSSFDPLTIGQEQYSRADELDSLHGNPSSFAGDLSAFRAAGKKMIMYHGMADPLVAGSNSQRYYLKVAKEMGISNNDMDGFMRLFRVSGMAHCGVGGISGAGAWMFGQSSAAASASNSIIQNMMDWVENNDAPDTLAGTKFWYDTPDYGVQFQRNHCRFPYRTTYRSGDANLASSWGCDLIQDWQNCAVGAVPRLCNADGSFE